MEVVVVIETVAETTAQMIMLIVTRIVAARVSQILLERVSLLSDSARLLMRQETGAGTGAGIEVTDATGMMIHTLLARAVVAGAETEEWMMTMRVEAAVVAGVSMVTKITMILVEAISRIFLRRREASEEDESSSLLRVVLPACNASDLSEQ